MEVTISTAAQITDEDYDFLMDIIIRGTMITTQEACKAMRGQEKGVIINYGSISGLRKEPSVTLY
ncbi:SDR family NAD(P)-dependent oxidoreductase [Shouchella shacheensis]|uniref:SDR family NAD(P)-dependent oxidoreductase n=1 Tax=Shouchella shacheensis TaxID=1649580 RepID=UPI000A948552